MKHLITFFVAAVLMLSWTQQASAQIDTTVVISEIYGGGGNGGSTWTNDFIELYNPTGSSIDMTGWSVQYASTAGTTWQVTNLTGSIASHGFYLVQELVGAGGTTPLPTPDATGVIPMAAGSGKIAIVNTTTALSGSDPHTDPSVVDFVGYGTANAFEGTGPTGTLLTSTSSAERKAKNNSSYPDSMGFGGADSLKGNGWTTHNNSADFVVHSPLPNPQNSSAPLETPPVIGNISPIIGTISRSFFVAEVSGVDTIKANVSDLDGTVATVKLNIRVNGGAVDSSIVMTLGAPAQYVGLIPASKHTVAGNLVEYWVSATDNLSASSTTASTPGGYFVGDAPISSIKSHTTAAVNGYAARVNGTLNVNTNLYASGQGFIQDATGGLQIFKTGGMAQLSEGRNVKVQGSLVPFASAFELQDPNFAFVDTTLGTSVVSPLTITLPITQTPQSLNEGRLVKIVGMSTAAVGNFAASTSYSYNEADLDTISVRVESNAGANNLVGKAILATPVDAIGILSYNNAFLRLKPRKDSDMGYTVGNGTGTASISPTFRFTGLSAVAETLTVTGDGVNTLEGVSVTIPDTWTWDGSSRTLSGGPGFGGASSSVTGTGVSGDPWVITVTSAAVTNVNTGSIRITNLGTPALTGNTDWVTRTRVPAGSLSTIASQPVVNIVSGFEAVNDGLWSNPATWSNSTVPGASDNVTFTTRFKTVTIDIPNAQCNNLTMTGDTTIASSGPVLKFDSIGTRQLTVNGRISISGGSGGGGGNPGGRPQLTSNGNASAVLIVKGGITTTSSNTTANGNAGMNMNEGTVKLTGATTDTIRAGAGLRLGNLEVGDGSSAKTAVTVAAVSATLSIRSLTVKQNSTLWAGSANNNGISIGNIGNAGVATLTGGITVETGASLRVQKATNASSSNINLFGGGITNNGILNLLSSSPDSGRYNVNVDSASQTIGGSAAGTYGNMTVGPLQTLTLQQDVNINSAYKMTLNGTLSENSDKTVIGKVEATRVVGLSAENFGGIGAQITAGSAPGSTVVTRVTGQPQLGLSIARYFDIVPATNTGLGASFIFKYDSSEITGHNPNTFQLWESTNSGSTWSARGGSVSTGARTITLGGVNSFARWTASDATHGLDGSAITTSLDAGWNLISNPVTVPAPSPGPHDSVKTLFAASTFPYAFRFAGAGGYQQEYRLTNGVGYWEKFASAGVNNFSPLGSARPNDSLVVAANWNIVGSVTGSVDTTTITTDAGIPLAASHWFRYQAGYLVASSLEQGKGYWKKASRAGKFYVTGTEPAARPTLQQNINPLEALNSVTITDSKGGAQTLYFGSENSGILASSYEMPPVPPAEAFDARFSAADAGFMVRTHPSVVENIIDLPVDVQSVAYPLTISWNILSGSYTLTDAVGGQAFSPKSMTGAGSVRVSNSAVNKFTIKVVAGSGVPMEFSLSQNYPNPFNPTTNIRFALPVQSKVTIDIYNVLGQKVRTLLKEDRQAGFHVAEWNGTGNAGQQLGSGVYFLQLSATGANGKSFNEVRKLMMLK